MGAGAVDVIGFLGLGGLFAAHITGNLVIIAAHFTTGKYSQIGPLCAVPVFILVLGLVTILGEKIKNQQFPLLKILLIVQTLLLIGSYIIGMQFGPFIDIDSPLAVMTGMLAVAAMAMQSASVKLALKKSPSTVAMTMNLTQMTLNFLQLIRKEKKPLAHLQVTMIFACILGFIMGCGLGAILQVEFGFQALLLPIGLTAIAVFLLVTASPKTAI